MSPSIITMLELLPVIAGFGFSVFWMTERNYAYNFFTKEQMLKGFSDVVLPDGFHPSVLEGFDRLAITPMYNDKERGTLLRVHLALGWIGAIIMMLQVTPAVRKLANHQIHRVLGMIASIVVIVFEISLGYVLFVKGMVNIGAAIYWMDVVMFFAVLIFYPVGIWAILNKNVRLHRQCMILSTASMLGNPIQRFFWSVFSKQLKWGFPWKNIDEWLTTPTSPTGVALFVSITVTICVACYFAFAKEPSKDDMKFHRVEVKKIQ
jgi:hypothetical protein